MTYAQTIEKAKKHAASNPPQVDTLSLEDLCDFVGIISDTLKEPGIGAFDRLIMNEERKVYRAELARRQA